MKAARSWRAGARAAEDIASMLLGLPVRKAIDPLTDTGFLLICERVTNKLMKAAQGAELQVVKQAIDELDIDWAELSPAAIEATMNAVAKAVSDAYYSRVLPRLSEVFLVEGPAVLQAVRLAVIAREHIDISPHLAARDTDAEEAIRKAHYNFIRDSTGRRVEMLSERARDVVSRGIAQGLSTNVIGKDLEREFADEVPRPDSYWRVVADAFVGRARTASQIGAYEDAGIETYEVVAVLDEVTTDICRFMDGKIFQVSAARGLLNKLSDLEEPEEVKFANPWVRVGKNDDGSKRLYIPNADGTFTTIANVLRSGVGSLDDRGSYSGARSDAELAALGIPVPPYHGRCRSVIVAGPE